MIYYVRKTTNGNYRAYNALTDAVLPNIAGCVDLQQAHRRLAAHDPDCVVVDDTCVTTLLDQDLLRRIDHTRTMLLNRQIVAKAADGYDYTNPLGILLKQAALTIKQLIRERDQLKLRQLTNQQG